jgi:chromosome segregation ATPase
MATPELSDSYLLKLYTAGGYSYIKIEDRTYERHGGESPLQFITRVRNEEYAVYAREENEAAQKAREARAASQDAEVQQPSVGERSSNGSSSGPAIQSLEEVLRNQATILEERIRSLRETREKYKSYLDEVTKNLDRDSTEYGTVQKFLKQYKNKKGTNGDTSEVPQQVG